MGARCSVAAGKRQVTGSTALRTRAQAAHALFDEMVALRTGWNHQSPRLSRDSPSMRRPLATESPALVVDGSCRPAGTGATFGFEPTGLRALPGRRERPPNVGDASPPVARTNKAAELRPSKGAAWSPIEFMQVCRAFPRPGASDVRWRPAMAGSSCRGGDTTEPSRGTGLRGGTAALALAAPAPAPATAGLLIRNPLAPPAGGCAATAAARGFATDGWDTPSYKRNPAPGPRRSSALPGAVKPLGSADDAKPTMNADDCDSPVGTAAAPVG